MNRVSTKLYTSYQLTWQIQRALNNFAVILGIIPKLHSRNLHQYQKDQLSEAPAILNLYET